MVKKHYCQVTDGLWVKQREDSPARETMTNVQNFQNRNNRIFGITLGENAAARKLPIAAASNYFRTFASLTYSAI